MLVKANYNSAVRYPFTIIHMLKAIFYGKGHNKVDFYASTLSLKFVAT